MFNSLKKWVGHINIMDCSVGGVYKRDVNWVCCDNTIDITDNSNEHFVRIEEKDIVGVEPRNNRVVIHVCGIGKVTLTGWEITPVSFGGK